MSDPDTVTVEPKTVQALPAGAHARRVAALEAPGPQVSQQIATATLREEEADTARQMIQVGRWLRSRRRGDAAVHRRLVSLRIALALAIALAIVVGIINERRLEEARRVQRERRW